MNAQQLEDVVYYVTTNGRLSTLRLLLRTKSTANVDRLLRGNTTMLHLAANRGYFSLVPDLLSNDADVDARDKKGNTTLHVAAQRLSRGIRLLETLRSWGAELEARNPSGLTALHVAAKAGVPVSVHLLVNLVPTQTPRIVAASPCCIVLRAV